MVGPVAHVRHRIADFALQSALHKLAEGYMRAVMITTVAQDKIHRYIERPFDIVDEAKVFREDKWQYARALVVGVAPDIGAPRQKIVRLAFGER